MRSEFVYSTNIVLNFLNFYIFKKPKGFPKGFKKRSEATHRGALKAN